MKDILDVIGAGDIDIMDYGRSRSVFEVQFGIANDSRVFTTFIEPHEMAGAAFEAGMVENHSSFNVWTDYENDVCMHVEKWFRDICDDREKFIIACIKNQVKDTLKALASYARKCPDKFDFCNMNWMQKQAVFDLWANRCFMPGAGWVKSVVSLILDNKGISPLPPEHWKFAQLAREAIQAAKHPTPENASVSGRLFWLTPKTANEYQVTIIEKIAV